MFYFAALPRCCSNHCTIAALARSRSAPSPAMIDVARVRFPGLDFRVGSMLTIDAKDTSWSGAVALYSMIHFVPDERRIASRELARVLRPDSPLLPRYWPRSKSKCALAQLAQFPYASPVRTSLAQSSCRLPSVVFSLLPGAEARGYPLPGIRHHKRQSVSSPSRQSTTPVPVLQFGFMTANPVSKARSII